MIDIADIRGSIDSRTLIKDPFIRTATFQRDGRGRLVTYTGGFTVVFPCIVNGEKWAFRCGHSVLDATIERFKILSEAIENLSLQYFTAFKYVDNGIVVNGKVYPTTRMKWIEGVDLKSYLYKYRYDSEIIIELGKSFFKMCKELHSKSIAHGDLQHGNILVDDIGKLHLIDYDSVYVPQMKSIRARDIIAGKPDYQHPARKRNLYANEKLDYFSEVIILTSILAIAKDPELADKYQLRESDSMLFHAEDFSDFSNSRIYSDLISQGEAFRILLGVISNYLRKRDILEIAPIEIAASQVNQSGFSVISDYLNKTICDYPGVSPTERTGTVNGSTILTYRYYGKRFPKNIIVPSGVRVFKGFSSEYEDRKYLEDVSCDYSEERHKVLSAVESVEISSGVEEIGASAFKECYNLKRVGMPEGIKRIGDRAFMYCTGLSALRLPDSLNEIGQDAFFNCNSLNNIAIPNHVTRIGASAFSLCTKIVSLVIPKGVTELEDSVLSGAYSLENIVIPNTVSKIDSYAFCGCIALKSLTIPESVIEIGRSAFMGCKSLTAISIPNSVMSIGYAVFANCTSLTTVYIPKKFRDMIIESEMFAGCDFLKRVILI